MKKLILLFVIVLFIEEMSPKPARSISGETMVWTVNYKVQEIDFRPIFDQIRRFEGGYGHDPHDAGGETYCGISRVSNPRWSGWSFIDSHKPIRYNQKFKELDNQVYNFYYHRWKHNRLDMVGNQELSDRLFNISVNLGSDVASRLLVESLNLLNINGKRYPEIKDYKGIDNNVLSVLYSCKSDSLFVESLNKTVKGLQLNRYVNICKNNPKKKRYLTAWLKRI